jgi:predicted negative regulator of RcsB-dependent stress response
MDIHETEEQQVEALKHWWKENGSSIITGVLLGLALLFGAKSWFAYQERVAENASNIYATMMVALDNDEETVVNEKAGTLIADYSATPYAPLAALTLAKIKLERGELEAAHAQLQWALDNTDSDVIGEIVRLRLARVMLAEGNPGGAEALIGTAGTGTAFEPLYLELSGDIEAARDNPGGARDEYRQALADMPPGFPGRPVVELKYEGVASSGEAGVSR